MTDLAGRVALVTGAGRGIGRVVAETLADAGAAVGLTARSTDELDDVAAAIRDAGGQAVAVPGDVTEERHVQRVVDQVVSQLGPVDLLVNNAGTSPRDERKLWETEPAAWWRVVEVNLRGPFHFTHATVGGMVERGRGHIINVNSLGGVYSRFAGFSQYGVSKAGLFRLTDALAVQLEGTGVAVFDISPGLVRTAMTDDMEVWEDVPEEHWTPPERTAEVVLALASGRFDRLTGRFLHVTEDLDELLAHADEIVERDARKLRLRFWGDDDPLAG